MEARGLIARWACDGGLVDRAYAEKVGSLDLGLSASLRAQPWLPGGVGSGTVTAVCS